MAVDITEKQAFRAWSEYVDNIRKATALYTGETEEQQRRRIGLLEADPELWFKYYFPQYSYAEPAGFHKKATKRVINNLEWYEVRMWSRELAKSTRTMMEVLYLCLTGKKKYVLLISNSLDNAVRLLDPYRGNLEANQRIIHDYGEMLLPGSWTAEEFTTRRGFAFRALGAGQSPRGTRNEEVRPDVILFDDIDTDEECRNPDIIDKKWKWIEEAAISTRSVSRKTTIIFCGNKIATDCCVARAGQFADIVDIVNILDFDMKTPSWPQKNSIEDIKRILSQKSWEAQQKEYFNNPVSQGQTFKEIHWGKCPPLSSLDWVLQYADPATSNKDKPLQKSRANNSCKGTGLLGYKDGRFYLYTCYLDNMSNSDFIDALYGIREYVKLKSLLYSYLENNTLQDPFYEQVLLPLIFQKGKDFGGILSITPDDTKKPEKWARIEADLEPLVRLGLLIFNEEERGNPHMKRMESQFLTATPNSRELGGPDLIQGGVKIIQKKIAVATVGGVEAIRRLPNKKRW